MKIFLSWSGSKSRRVAEELRKWLPAVVQAARPYFSPDDISKGARWNTEIAKELEDSRLGILCLTKHNISAPWLMFEAGALAKSLDKSRVIPLLLDVEPADLSGPLSQFQAARFDRTDVKRLVDCMNEELGPNALDDLVLNAVFEKWWPDLEANVLEIINETDASPTAPARSDRQVLEEVLDLLRHLSFLRMDLVQTPRIAAGFYASSPIESLDLTVRAESCLKANGISSIGDLLRHAENDLLKTPNLGRKALNEIKEVLAARSLALGMVLDDGGAASNK